MKNDLLHIPEFDINIVYCQNIEIYSVKIVLLIDR